MFDSCICLYDGDFEHPKVIRTEWRRASKTHHCCECCAEISKGARYEYTAGLWDGRWSIFRTCKVCTDVRASLFSCGHAYGQLWEDIWEHFGEEEDDETWLLPEGLQSAPSSSTSSPAK